MPCASPVVNLLAHKKTRLGGFFRPEIDVLDARLSALAAPGCDAGQQATLRLLFGDHSFCDCKKVSIEASANRNQRFASRR